MPLVPPVLSCQPAQPASAVGTDAAMRVGLSGNTFDVSKHIALVAQFREIEVDLYFNVFERIASA